jgi:Ca-activated chloride channel family protein
MAPSFLFGELRETHAQGNPVPLRHTQIEATLFGPLAKICITQYFYNSRPNAIEAVYVMPLSHQGAVSGLSLWVGERVIRGVMKEKEEAKDIYEEAKNTGAPAALLQQEQANLFTLSVANIQPHESVRVELTLEELLPFDGGCFRLVVPLTYVPPYRPKDLPEEPWMNAPFITSAGFAPREDQTRTISVSVQGSFASPLAGVRSTSFAINLLEEQLTEGIFSLQLAAKDEAPDQDFIVEVWPATEQIAPILLSHKAQDKTGTFLLTLLPSVAPGPKEFAPREVAFIIDRSGSMGGHPMQQAKLALKGCLRALGPNDTFCIVAFDDHVEELCAAPLIWSQQTLDEADAYLSSIDSRGGTEIVPAFLRVLQRPKDPLRQRLIVFLTDGAVSNVEQSISTIEKNIKGDRVYTFGLGSSVNRALLDGVVKVGQGSAEYLGLNDDIEAAMLRFQARIAGPLLTELKLSSSPGVVTEVYPKVLPDLFAGQALQISGRWVGEEPVTLQLKGKRGAELFEGTLSLISREEPFLGASLQRLWAKRRIESLSDELRQKPSQIATIRQEILGLGILHHLVTQYTSLVAVEELQYATPPKPPEKVLVPNLLPKDVLFSSWLRRTGEISVQSELAPRTSSGFVRGQTPASTVKKSGGGFFSRLGSLMKSNVNDAINKAEDPEKLLNRVILEMNQQLVEAKKQVAVAIADEKRLAKQLEETQVNSKEQDKLTAHQHQLQKDATDNLKNSLRGLQNKIDEANRKKDLLIARTKRAESPKTVNSTLTGLSDASAFDTFDRMARPVDQLEAEAEAQSDLQLDYSGGGLDDKFAQLEPTSGTSEALHALKVKMGLAAQDPSEAPLRGKVIQLNATEKPKEIPPHLRALAREQRASGAWGNGKDEIKATCAAIVQMAAANETHRGGIFQAQLTRAISFLQEQLANVSGNDLLVVAWALAVVSMTTNHPLDQKLYKEALGKITTSDEASNLLRSPQSTEHLLQEGNRLFFGGILNLKQPIEVPRSTPQKSSDLDF